MYEITAGTLTQCIPAGVGFCTEIKEGTEHFNTFLMEQPLLKAILFLSSNKE